VSREEILQQAIRGCIAEAMPSASNGVEGHRHAGRFQRGLEQHALVMRHQPIGVAMRDEKWRIGR
jgi:hypothetical protein